MELALVGVDEIDLRASAILLDVDGTLLDIASTPSGVEVSRRLKWALARLVELTGGALALVSGRRLPDLDRLFAPLALAAVACHGAEIRLRGFEPATRIGVPIDDALKQRLAAVASRAHGVLFEDKDYTVALHYRLAPEQGEMIRKALGRIRADDPTAAIEFLPGKAVIEVKRLSFNKGTGVRELMAHAPFMGRRPVFVGDDITDEAVFAVLPEFGGIGLSVGRRIPGLAGFFSKPEEVRQWIFKLAGENRANEI